MNINTNNINKNINNINNNINNINNNVNNNINNINIIYFIIIINNNYINMYKLY